MTKAIVGKWGKSLAIRVPLDVARSVGLREGDLVEVDSVDGNIQVRPDIDLEAARRDARAAIAEIRAAAKGQSLGGLSIRALRDEGRPGCE